LNEILVPRNTLVVLSGPAGSGKSTWASKHFLPTQIVSSDECRALIVDDPANQSVSVQAFDLFHFIIEQRLMLGRLTVADATNLKPEHRRTLLRIARRNQFNAAAILFDVPIEICVERNSTRKRRVPQEALLMQRELFETTLYSIRKEKFDYVHVLDQEMQSNVAVRIGRYLSRRSR
jgi:protein phosphatase